MKSIESISLFDSIDELGSSVRGNLGIERVEDKEDDFEYINTDRTQLSGNYSNFITRRSTLHKKISQNV